ncbi:MAG: recombinase family protein [Bacillota bacterium]|nr:recombinase family protein [Bacillota bacterium]MDW7684398.1 recombinase family protein [Bacillota bacterium]
MKTGFAYARVSSKDQEKQGNSIPEQLLRIQEFACSTNITIIKTFQDTGSAYHDENREQFNLMITEAIKDRPSCIIVDESSRFARTREVSAATKKLFRKHGIEVLLANEENVNPRTSSGLWLDGIRDIKNEAHSLDISHNTIRGMNGNIKNRDSETGWCYKNGGRAPFGYQIKKLDKGTSSKGKPILKSIWELHPENAEVARLIIVDLYTKQEMSPVKIRDYLNNRHIASPSGEPWGTSTINEMLRDNRLEQYAGTAFWNKENRHTVGSRFNPREEWIEVIDAHPAIISHDELQDALKRKAKGQKNYTYSRTKDSPYLFTGKSLEGKSLFICTACGGNIIGYRSSSRNWRKYVCGTHRYKGDAGCSYKLMVNQEWLENIIVQEIENRYTLPSNIDKLIKEVKDNIESGCQDYYGTIDDFVKQKKDLEQQARNLANAIKNGISLSIIQDEATTIQQEISEVQAKITYLKNNPPTELNFDEEQIKEFFLSFRPSFDAGTNSERKALIRTFIRQMELDPENKEVRVVFYPDLVHRIGVGDGT